LASAGNATSCAAPRNCTRTTTVSPSPPSAMAAGREADAAGHIRHTTHGRLLLVPLRLAGAPPQWRPSWRRAWTRWATSRPTTRAAVEARAATRPLPPQRPRRPSPRKLISKRCKRRATKGAPRCDGVAASCAKAQCRARKRGQP
jgi:hypothetical protein